ncbi:MAG TPA: hypothetical protein VEF04_00805, partial [Blastocatellia bacterium]|nr:hypothetical protein [Blastocatellia bacterium]
MSKFSEEFSADNATNQSRQIIRAACPHDCPDTCAMLVTIENGKAIKVQGDENHPTT